MSVWGHENKFRLGWHACDKMAANRATNSIFSRGCCPPFLGGAILHPPFLNFGPGRNALKLPQVSHILLALIITLLIARWQSITAAVQKLPDSVVNPISSSPQTDDVSCETTILRLAFYLFHVMYTGYKQVIVFNFIFDLFWNGRDFSVFSIDFTVPFAKLDTAAWV